MKKKIIMWLVIAVILILLIPIPMRLKDGGSIVYKAMLYTITKYHKIDFATETGYIDGWGIKVLGLEIYNSTKGKSGKLPVEKTPIDSKMDTVLSLEDKIKDNTAWCGTFNLIWNDLKNDLAKQDIVFTPQLDIVKNLNKGTFTTSNLSEDSYYKVYGFPNLELKKKIEKAIKEKFNETSDILDDFDWENHDPDDYFLYTMLKKEFEFPKVFTELENDKFGNYENVKYFGINDDTAEEVREQVQVLYYNSKEDFAIKLITKGNDEVIISKGNNQETFGDMYNEIMQKNKDYKGSLSFAKNDILKIPNISFDSKEELKDLQDKRFLFSNGELYKIEKAIQTIQFDLDKKGGKIKSEAGMMVNKEAAMMPEETREFLVDDTFTIFLSEKGKELPYFAAKISDISKVQNDVIKPEVKEKSKLAQMYIDMIDYLMKQDKGLQSNIDFIAIDFNNFRRPLTKDEKEIANEEMKRAELIDFTTKEAEKEWRKNLKSKPIEEETKQEIVEYLKEKYPNVEIKQNTYEELEKQGLAVKNEGIKDGIIINVSGIPEMIEENKAQINLAKYRGPLGAYFIEFEMKYKNDKWQLKSLSEAIS